MTPQDHRGPEAGTSFFARRAAGLAVHAFTASGAVIGLLALVAAVEGRFTAMFVWLGLALVVDGIDGTLARRADVKHTAPEISGDILDLVVDYVTYVLVPAYALSKSGLLPVGFGLPAAALICVTSALYFADVRMKTDDWYFRGFPAVWNALAFQIFVLAPPPWIALGVVALFAGLTFTPIAFVHPMRVTRWRRLTLVMLAAWSVLAALALWWNLSPPTPVRIGLGAIGLYFLIAGVRRPRQRT